MKHLSKRLAGLAIVSLVASSGAVHADTLELRNGKSLSGDYRGGSSNNVRFSSGGSTQTYSVADVDSLFFEHDGDGDANAEPTVADSADNGGGDTLELRSGESKVGDYSGGSSGNIRFRSGGAMYTYPRATVDAIFFTADPAAAAAAGNAAPAAAAAPAPAAAPAVEAGSRIMVRLGQAIDSRRQQAGFRFTGRLEGDLVAGGQTVAPRGANVYGVLTNAQQSGRIAGRSQLTLTLTDIMVNNQMRPVVTSSVKAVTDNTAGSTARRTLGAAAIGALIDGKSGAKTGAAVGAGASILTQGESISIPAGTLLEFRLGQPFQP